MIRRDSLSHPTGRMRVSGSGKVFVHPARQNPRPSLQVSGPQFRDSRIQGFDMRPYEAFVGLMAGHDVNGLLVLGLPERSRL